MNKSGGRYQLALALGALGVVYGDIGTSPLYALRECFSGAHAVEPTAAHVLGVLSLIFWCLVGVVSVKYLALVMRADNKGEGGILALLALAVPERGEGARGARWLVVLGVFGAALLYGDGMITPAITVLGAVEGLEVATPLLKPYVVPIAVGVLVVLFSFQRYGTGRVGGVFGPVMLVWFAALAVLGVKGIVEAPEVLRALSPHHGLAFLVEDTRMAFVVLGSVFLSVTGAEALYADMGHFGVRPIRRAWFAVVFPGLLLNYLGQGALLLRDPAAATNPFFLLAPGWALYGMVALATAAAVIASQALISGAYSLTMQGIQLGYFPRLNIRHTSQAERGQIYMPYVNWVLMLACVGLVVGFGSSTRLAGAYGIAVSLTMLITTVLLYGAARRVWGWARWQAAGVCVVFGVLELVFLGANTLKLLQGGWFPLLIGAGIYALMTTWKTGRRILGRKLAEGTLPWDLFLKELEGREPRRVPGTAVYLAGNPKGTPLALLHNLKHNKVLHERVILLTIANQEIPHVPAEERVRVEKLRADVIRVIGRYGFMEQPNVPELLEACGRQGLEVKPMETSFFLSRETVLPGRSPGMALWRRRLFGALSRNAQPATAFFGLPANRVVELGMQVEL